MIEFRKGNVISADAEALVNTVNCVGIMGRGVALHFKSAFPDNYRAYRAACKRSEVQPGKMFITETGQLSNPRYIINFPTKRHWRGKSKMEDIEAGLRALEGEIRSRDIRSIAMPALGSGLGGLPWPEVRQRIERALSGLDDVRIIVFEPMAHAPPPLVEVPEMTRGRAALIVLVDRYLRGLMDVSITLLELHKLMYFMQEAGEPLRLRFEKAPHGPFAANLRHVLQAMEGHLVTGYDDRGDHAAKPLALLPGAVADADAFLREHAETLDRCERVGRLVAGFESPFGLELLATAHWVAAREGASSLPDVIARAHEWSDTKRSFTEEQLETAFDTLLSQRWLPPHQGVEHETTLTAASSGNGEPQRGGILQAGAYNARVAVSVAVGQRLRLRARIWDVEDASDAGGGQLLALRNASNPLETLRVIADVERFEILPPPQLDGPLAPYRDWKILHDALTLVQRPAPGELVGFDQARITAEDYQLIPTIRAFQRPMQRILIADDVGLGKTVEAILLMLELRARRRADRILVVCPAGLQDQWSDELLDKAGLEFEIFDAEHVREIVQQHQRGENPWDVCRRIITSIDYVKRLDVRRRLRDPKWDLVIVDEAHYLSETSSGAKTYRTARSRFGQFIARQTESLVLLTATPHTGDPQSFYSLISLVDDKLVASPSEMTRERTAPVVVRRYKKDIRDPIDPSRSRFPSIDVATISVPFAEPKEAELYRLVHRYTQRRWKRAGADTAVGFAMTVIKKRLVSCRAALIATLEARRSALSDEPLEVDVKRGLLADYRAGAPLSEQETEAAESRVIAAPPVDSEDRAGERRELDKLIATARSVPGDDSKALQLLRALDELTTETNGHAGEKAMVFTEFRDTHDFLRAFLERNGYAGRIATLTGAMNRAQRTAEIKRFADPGVAVLLATDAASEGLNLQEHCRVLFHYELPWNPNRLEQRNGRVHRYGQKHPVLVRNLALSDTLDARILDLLMQKTQRIYNELGSAADVIGVMGGIDWGSLLMDTSGLAENPAEADVEVRRAQERIERDTERTKRELLAWQDRFAPSRSTFDEMARREVDQACATSAHLRLSPDRRRAVVERAVSLAGGRVEQAAGDAGVVRIVVPQRLRLGVADVIERAVFDPADTPRGARGVALLVAQHPLLQAIGVAARAALYDPTAPFARARLAAKIANVPNAGVLFTFVARFALADGETYAEEMIPVLVAEGMPCGTTAAEDRALLDAPELSGAPRAGVVERLRTTLFVERRGEAEGAALERTVARAQEFLERERSRSARLAEDVERWAHAKRAWLEAQLAPANRVMSLILDEETAAAQREDDEAYRRQRRRFEQELETLDLARRERLDAIARRQDVRAPEHLEFVGALFLVPVYETESR
ncbi:MAG: macro domain-containing protein [Methylocystis sp.]